MAFLWQHLMCDSYERSDDKKYHVQKQEKFNLFKDDS